ncbi:MAG: preprotein translocase subunit SecE [Candidatus Sericytochromatia bacterium]|nr:preprotein translocase subunit SecE [Candidatus Sericytochromatia bacterium]
MDHPKRDLKDTDTGLTERLDAAKGSLAAAQLFARDTVAELKKVQWPSRRQAGIETAVVLITVAIVTATVTTFDWILTYVTNLLFST